VVRETDLLVRADKPLETETKDLILKHRIPLERYLERHPEFVHAMVPWPLDKLAPPIVKTMIAAGENVGVGPMAAVAGAIAEYVGRDLLVHSKDVIVENGGDVFIRTCFPLVAGIFAGKSPLSSKIGVRIDSPGRPVANKVSGKDEIEPAIAFGEKIKGVMGIVVIVDSRIGLWGDVELTQISEGG
jgi:ApbE superfamily uncharacterized protein (UPF0280 family)